MHGLPFFWFNISHLWGREGETWLAQRCFFFFLLLKEAFSHSSVLSLRRFYYQPLCFYVYKSFLQLLWIWKKKALVWRERANISCLFTLCCTIVIKRKKGNDTFVPVFKGIRIPERRFFLSAWFLSFSQVHRRLTACACFTLAVVSEPLLQINFWPFYRTGQPIFNLLDLNSCIGEGVL